MPYGAVLLLCSLFAGPSAHGWQQVDLVRRQIDEIVSRAETRGIAALGELAWLGPEGVERLLSIAKTLGPYERAVLAEHVSPIALARIRPPREWFDGGIAMQLAVELLRVRREIDPAWWDALVAATSVEAEHVALVALEVLARWFDRDQAARDHVRAFLSHPSVWRRRAALHALVASTGDVRAFEEELLAATADADRVVRIAATWALRDPVEPNERVERRLRELAAEESDVALVARHALFRRTLPPEPLLAAVRALPERIRLAAAEDALDSAVREIRWNTALRLARNLPEEHWDADLRTRVERELRSWAHHLWALVLDKEEWRHAATLAKLGEMALIAFEERPPQAEWLRGKPYHWFGSAFVFAGLVEFGKELPDDTAWPVYAALLARPEAELPYQLVDWPRTIGRPAPVAAIASLRFAHEICAGTLRRSDRVAIDGLTLWRSLGDAGRAALEELRAHPDARVRERAGALVATLAEGEGR